MYMPKLCTDWIPFGRLTMIKFVHLICFNNVSQFYQYNQIHCIVHQTCASFIFFSFVLYCYLICFNLIRNISGTNTKYQSWGTDTESYKKTFKSHKTNTIKVKEKSMTLYSNKELKIMSNLIWFLCYTADIISFFNYICTSPMFSSFYFILFL